MKQDLLPSLWRQLCRLPTLRSNRAINRLIIGRVRRAHGVRGALLVEAKCDAPDTVFVSGRVVYEGSPDGLRVKDTPYRIVSARNADAGWIVVLEGLSDRSIAQAWKAKVLHADLEELEAPEADQIWVHDLIGAKVQDHSGKEVGDIKDVYDAPQGLIIEVATDQGSRLVPWRNELIAESDWEARTVRLIDLPGLID